MIRACSRKAWGAGLWLAAFPWSHFVSGWERLVLLFVLSASVLAWLDLLPLPGEAFSPWCHRLLAWVNLKPWWRVLLLCLTAPALLISLWGNAVSLFILAMALGPWLLVPITALAFLFTLAQPRPKALPVWAAFVFLLLLAKVFLGPPGGRGLDIPILPVVWALTAALLGLALFLNTTRWWLMATALNLFGGLAILEFYLSPLAGQEEAVRTQQGVEGTLVSDSRLDLRWAVEGCDGLPWAGARKFGIGGKTASIIHANETITLGSGAADNGAVDCQYKTLMTADQSPGGRLYVYSWPDKKILFKNKGSGGFAGLTYVPHRAWLFAALETGGKVLWLNLKDPANPQQITFNVNAAHPAACQSKTFPCLLVIGHRTLTGFYGDTLDKRIEKPRPGKSLGPTLAIDETRNRVLIASFLSTKTWLLELKTLQFQASWPSSPGMRYLIYWPARQEFWGANFFNGWFYAWDKHGAFRRTIYAGRKARWLNLSPDGKRLLWCAASACYQYQPSP